MSLSLRRSVFALFVIAAVVFAPGANHFGGQVTGAGDSGELAARMLAPTFDTATAGEPRSTLDKRADKSRSRGVPGLPLAVLLVLTGFLLGPKPLWKIIDPKIRRSPFWFIASQHGRAPPLLQPA